MTSAQETPIVAAAARTGIDGLDNILGEGLQRNRLYLIEGEPGTGKTTLALQFLIEGARLNEKCLYITLAETEEELRAAAASHGWDLKGIDIFELLPPESLLDENQQQSLLYSSDLELGETTRMACEAITRAMFLPHRLRQRFPRSGAARAIVTALSPPVARAQALCSPAMARLRPAARRSDRGGQ